MGRAAILALVSFAAIGAIRATQSLSSRQHLEQGDARTRFEMLARNASLFGYERSKQQAVVSPSSQTLTGTFDVASYRAAVAFSGNVATVRSVGVTSDGNGQALSYRVVSQIERLVTIPSSAPQFMQFAMLSNEDLTLSGSMMVDTFRVGGDARAPANANVHTNGTIRVSGGSAIVRGFGTYVTGKVVSKEEQIFRPYNNPTSAPVLSQTAPVLLPAFTAKGLSDSLGADRSTSGSLTLNTTYDFTTLGATREDPYVWYVNGNVTVADGTKLKGYVIFAVNGTVTLSGGQTMALSNGFAESNAAWYAAGDITFTGNSEIWGQFYTASNAKFSGTPRIYGSIATRRQSQISGTPNVFYVAPSAALTTYWQKPEVRLRRLSYSEGW